MQKPANSFIKLFAALLLVALICIFAFNAKRYISSLEKEELPLASLDDEPYANTSISLEMLKVLEWKNLDKLTQAVGTSRDKIRQVTQLTGDLKNPAAIYLRGFLLIITNKPLRALKTFGRLDIKDMPPAFLYPPYRLKSQIHPKEPNRYLEALNQAIDAGSVSPLITARVQAWEGKPSSALSSYLQTDPAQWVAYDVKCIKKIGRHSGLSSEIRRMIAGALKAGRVSTKIVEPLRQVLSLEIDPAEIRVFKRQLKEELIQGSRTGKLAVSSIKRLLETRKLFLQHDYQMIIDQHKDDSTMALTHESVLLLFLSGVRLENRLEMDRWGQEIKRRYPNQEVINWVSELTTFAK